jgi:signal transduction histidine kinase
MQKKAYVSSLDLQGKSLVRMLAHTIRVPIFTENTDEMVIPVQGLMLQQNIVAVTIWNKDKKLLFQEIQNGPKETSFSLSETSLQRILNDKRGSEIFIQETAGFFLYGGQVYFQAEKAIEDTWYVETSQNQLDKEIVGYVTVHFSKDSYRDGISNIFIQTGAFAIIYLVVCVLLIVFVIHIFTRQLQDLLSKIKRKRPNSKGPSDLDFLEETYDELFQALAYSFERIESLNESLEEKVLVRTHQLNEVNQELFSEQIKLKQTNTELATTLTDLQNTQDQLIQQEKLAAMGRLVAGVAHEMNNTVNFVSSALPSLHRSFDEIKELCSYYEKFDLVNTVDEVHERVNEVKAVKGEIYFDELFPTIDQLLANIDEGVRRTTRIVNDLRIFSRVSSEKYVFVDLHDLINTTIGFMDKDSIQQIIIHRKYGCLPLVRCLPERMSQVVFNILQNAVQAIKGKGSITIATECRGATVHLFFSDTGSGISDKDKQKVFDLFFTTKEVGQGTGLGLGISYSIVKQQGGDIRVHSERGKGATFEIILPVQSPKHTINC